MLCAVVKPERYREEINVRETSFNVYIYFCGIKATDVRTRFLLRSDLLTCEA